MSLEIILGPMFSGKSSRILSIVSRYSALNVPIVVIKHSADNRYSANELATHDGRRYPCVSVAHLGDVDIRMAEVVIIEEAQFFQGLLPFVHHAVDRLNKNVILVGLDGDSNRRPFGEILECIPLADKVEKLTALCHVCADGTPGIFTHRTGNYDRQMMVGGQDVYKAVCRYCYLDLSASNS